MAVNIVSTENGKDVKIDYCKNEACAAARIALLTTMDRQAFKLTSSDQVHVRQIMDVTDPTGTAIKAFGAGVVVISWKKST